MTIRLFDSSSIKGDSSVDELDVSKKPTKSKSLTKNRQLGNNNTTEESKFLTSKVREVLN